MKLKHRMNGFTALVLVVTSIVCVSACRTSAVTEPSQEGEYAVSVSIPVAKSVEGDTDVQSAVIYAFNVAS